MAICIEQNLPSIIENGLNTGEHITTQVTLMPVPSIAVTTQAGITAAALTAGATDTAGVITTTGTSTGSTVLTVTFGQPYATAPKVVILEPANASAAMPNSGYYVNSVSTTNFTVTVVAAGTYAATPSFRYLVIG